MCGKIGEPSHTMDPRKQDDPGDDVALKIMQNITDDLNTTTDSFERANLLRQAGVLLFYEGAKSSENLASFALRDVLTSYANVVTSVGAGSVNNYTGKVATLLKSSHAREIKWPTAVELPDYNELVSSECYGDYEDCRLQEVSSHDYEIFGKSLKKPLLLQPKAVALEPQNRSECETPTIFPSPSNAAVAEQQRPCSSGVSNQSFRTARDEFTLQNLKKFGKGTTSPQNQHEPLFAYGTSKKSLGSRRNVQNKFIPPVKAATDTCFEKESTESNDQVDERLKNIDPKMIELISSEIMSNFKPVAWNDIAGLEYAKSIIQEAVVWPILRPDIFTGLRRPPRGILLFGPPGTGKTLIGKCIASQSKSTFFSISASSLTSKWIGDGEKMVRALFAVAAVHQPSVVFIDEVDSLLCQRSETEHESSRRIKTEFLVQLDGAVTSEEERILIVGATNRPQELDEAARRRFVRRLYIPLPEQEARLQILKNLLNSVRHTLNDMDIENVAGLTKGYSGADMESLCREASMEPIRSIPPSQILFFNENEVREICFEDFQTALKRIRASVSQNDLSQYNKWNEFFGSGTVR